MNYESANSIAIESEFERKISKGTSSKNTGERASVSTRASQKNPGKEELVFNSGLPIYFCFQPNMTPQNS